MEDGRIAHIGADLPVPEGCKVIDAEGLSVYPGFVEAHGHIGLDGTAIGYEGKDYNEYNDPVTPSCGPSTASTPWTRPCARLWKRA